MKETVNEIKVTGSFDESDWYAKCIGQKFTVIGPAWWSSNEGDCYYVEHPENTDDTVHYVLKRDCEITESVASSDAPETTALPSETAAVEGILTEEELIKDIIRKLDWPTYPESSHHRYDLEQLDKAIKESKVSYLSANAELSFKNQKLTDAKKTYEKALGLIADATYEGPVGALKWRDIANDALEAYDHE